MTPRTGAGLSLARLIFEAVVAAAIGVAAVAVLNSSWWSACCAAVGPAISAPLLPGLFIAMLVGGGPHGVEPHHIYLGVAVEFFALWIMFRLLTASAAKR